MKVRRNREISVFSLSALDVFASALGAFILIALVMIPSFPNQSPVVVLTPPPPEPPPPAPPAPPVTQFPALDLVVVLDLTSSMEDFIEGLKSDIDNLVRVLSVMSPSLHMGVVGYGDRDWTRQRIFDFSLERMSDRPANVEALRNFVLGLEMNGGCGVAGRACENPGYPEDFRHALKTAREMPWRSESERKVIVMITDAPAYAEELAPSIEDARTFAAQGGGAEVSTVFCDTGEYGEFSYTRGEIEWFLRSVAEAGGEGQFTEGGASFVATILLALM